MIAFYQHLPSLIDPVAFSIGSFGVRWYSIMWIFAFGVCYGLLIYRVKKEQVAYSIQFIHDLAANALLGALLGGRVGYVVFYDLAYYLKNPIEIISPYSFVLDQWVGIYGMSYHGGIIGVMVAVWWTVRNKKMQIISVFDLIALVVPLGYMFGRIGNFLNQELVGRVTTAQWGMYFNNEYILRYPSQLLEAFFEGLVIFIILWSLRNMQWRNGTLAGLYVILYACARIGVEYFRQPDEHLGFVIGSVTMGQFLSYVMLAGGIVLLIWIYRDKVSCRLHR